MKYILQVGSIFKIKKRSLRRGCVGDVIIRSTFCICQPANKIFAMMPSSCLHHNSRRSQRPTVPCHYIS